MNEFLILINYISKVYIRVWFKIKKKTSIAEESRHLHEQILRNRYLKAELRMLVDVVILQNTC